MKPFSPRQQEIADLLVTGKTNREIADALGITEGTMKIHLATMFNKAQVRNRVELVLAIQASAPRRR